MSDSSEQSGGKKGTLFSRRHPDLVKHGGLARLLQFQFEAIGSPLQANEDDQAPTEDEYLNCDTLIEGEYRSCQVYIGGRKDRFKMDFWDRGVCLGDGYCSSPQTAAEMLDAWIEKNKTPEQIKEQFPSVEFSNASKAYVKGSTAFVEQRWQDLIKECQETSASTVLGPVVMLAHAHPVLGKLLPLTSMGQLCFSQRTGYPFAVVDPIIVPLSQPEEIAHGEEAQYEVHDHKYQPLLRGNAAEVIAFAVSCLPPHCGPAFLGTDETEEN